MSSRNNSKNFSHSPLDPQKPAGRFSKNARRAVEMAQKMGKSKNLKRITPHVLLKSVLAQKEGLGKNLAQRLEIDFTSLPKDFKKPNSNKKITAFDIISRALVIAHNTESPYVGTEHLILSFHSFLLETEKSSGQNQTPQEQVSFFQEEPTQPKESSASSDFFGLGFAGELNNFMESFFSKNQDPRFSGSPSVGNFRQKSPLKNFAQNLNEIVDENHQLIGRDEIVQRIANILGRKMKNNPVLLGDPGVGKTAIVEGLAKKINEGKVPPHLLDKVIYNLDLGLLIAGTTFRGEFEARLKEVIQEAKNNKNIILFVDEIHNLVGAGNAIGGLDAANMLKPALSRGEIQIIGATTFEEYRKHIEKDAALERRLQPIYIQEPTSREALQILKGIRSNYEKFHGVKIESDALAAAVSIAKRYIRDRFLPDSAIDLIDEASSQKRSLKKASPIYKEISQIEFKLKKIIQKKESAVVGSQFEEAISLRRMEKQLLEKLAELNKKRNELEKKEVLVVSKEDIEKTAVQMTGIPLSFISNQDKKIATNIKKSLRKNLVGQKEVIKKVNDVILRRLAGVSNPHRPLGSFLFIGPTGVGKTLTAKILSKAISPQAEESIIQVNMSEFMERHTVSRLLGAPAGYVGYEEGGELTEKIRRNPYSVVLFDEIEKADFSVLNILLQVLEEGEVADAKGRKVSFKNSIIILTSNIGTAELNQFSQLGFQSKSNQKIKKEKDKMEKAILQELNEILLPELINRLDEIIVFNPLQKKDIEEIVKQHLEKLAKEMKKKQINLSFEQKAIKKLVEMSIDYRQGARLARKNIQQIIEPLLADFILKYKSSSLAGKKIKLSIKKDNFSFQFLN